MRKTAYSIVWIATLLLAALALFEACDGRANGEAPPASLSTPPAQAVGEADERPPIPVVLISCDTLRADHLACYGYERETTPYLDAWARDEAVLFENAIVEQTQTLPSHMTMLTGLDPKNHGVTPDSNLPDSVRTLPEALGEHGYVSGGFTGHGWWLMAKRGFGQGFEHYDNAGGMFRHIHDTSKRLYAWLDAQRTAKLFLFFHNYDIHYKHFQEEGQRYKMPYDSGDNSFRSFVRPVIDGLRPFESPLTEPLLSGELLHDYRWKKESLNPAEHAILKAGYDDCVRMVDSVLHDLFERLKSQRRYDNALIIVTADHGESLNEHGRYGHADVWEEICRVPLLVRFPKGAHAGRRFAGQVQLADLYPTVLDVLGMPVASELDGSSLLSMLEGTADPRAHTFIRRLDIRAVRTLDWKLRWDRLSPEAGKLYRLSERPTETNDLGEEHVQQREKLRGHGERFFAPVPAGWHLRVEKQGQEWGGRATLASDESITEVLSFGVDGRALVLPAGDGEEFQHPLGAREQEHLLVKTATNRARLSVRIEGDVPFRLSLPGEPPQKGTTFSLELDPKNSPTPRTVVGDIARVSIWYIAPSAQRTAAPQATQETKAQLEALGYIDVP